MSRAGLIDRGILIRFCGNPVREGNRRSPTDPSVGLRRHSAFFPDSFFPGVQENFFYRSKKLLDISAQEE